MLLCKAIISHFGQACAVVCCQCLALVACCLPSSRWQARSQAEFLWRAVQPFLMDDVLYNMAVYLGFMFLPIDCLLPGVKVEALPCVLFSDVLVGEGEWYVLKKLRFPCPKPTDFLQCSKIILIKLTQSQLNSVQLAYSESWLTHAMKMKSFLI